MKGTAPVPPVRGVEAPDVVLGLDIGEGVIYPLWGDLDLSSGLRVGETGHDMLFRRWISLPRNKDILSKQTVAGQSFHLLHAIPKIQEREEISLHLHTVAYFMSKLSMVILRFSANVIIFLIAKSKTPTTAVLMEFAVHLI